jgi:hypothetical protein
LGVQCQKTEVTKKILHPNQSHKPHVAIKKQKNKYQIMGNGISTINIDTNASNLAAAADAANLPSIVSKLIRDEELDVQTALILDKEDISELCSKRMDQKRMMSAQLKLKAVMHSAEQGETKEDDQPVAKILNQPGIW